MPQDSDPRNSDRTRQSWPTLSAWQSRAGAWLAAAVLGLAGLFYAFTFEVQPDELGVVMRFGKVARQEQPGLHFRMPYPIDEVRLPKVTRQHVAEIGLRTDVAGPGKAARTSYVRGESQILTADENIVDLSFVVYWRIRDAQRFLFNIREPEETVLAVAESAMREVVGQSNLQPLLTAARQKTEAAVQGLLQSVLDRYGAGIGIDRVQLLRIDPPSQVIDAFRDVQAAATDKERLQNEALAYAGSVVPKARGDAQRILENAVGFRHQTVAEATGQAARFLKVEGEYSKAPDVTRTRLYLETMERILSRVEKIIIDRKAGVVPYLPLPPVAKRKQVDP